VLGYLSQSEPVAFNAIEAETYLCENVVISKEIKRVFITKISCLSMFEQMIAVHCEFLMKPLNILCEKNV
jgi:hypothetical protein